MTALDQPRAVLFSADSVIGGINAFRVDTTGLTINGTGGADAINALRSAPGEFLPSELGDVINGFGGNDTLFGGDGYADFEIFVAVGNLAKGDFLL